MRERLFVVDTYDTDRACAITSYCVIRAASAEEAYQRFIQLSRARRARLGDNDRHLVLTLTAAPVPVVEVTRADPT